MALHKSSIASQNIALQQAVKRFREFEVSLKYKDPFIFCIIFYILYNELSEQLNRPEVERH